MPKQQIAIQRFEGGLHTDADPRDIADNEFSVLKGFSVDSLGVIKLMGTHDDHSAIDGVDPTAFKAGYGIFPFASDYDDAGALVSTNYLALTDGSYVRIWDDGGGNTSNDAWDAMNDVAVPSTGFSLGETSTSVTDIEASFYAPEGDLRVCDGNFTNYANEPKLLSYIPAKTYGKGTNASYPTTFAQVDVGLGADVGGTTQDGWVVNDASVEAGVPTANLKMINTGSHSKGLIETTSGDNDLSAAADGTPGTVAYDTNAAALDFGTLNINAHYYNGMTCSFTPGSGASTSVTQYGVVVDYAHSGTTGTFKIWMGPNGDTSPYDAGVRHDSGNWGFQVGQQDGALWNVDLNGHARNRSVISADYGVTLTFDEGTATQGNWMPTANVRYKFYHSTIFDGNQESLPSVFTMYPRKAANGTTAHEAVDEMFFCNGDTAITAGDVGVAAAEIPVSFGLLVRMASEHDPGGSGNFTIGDSGFDEDIQDEVDATAGKGKYNFLGGNQRVTGGRVYWASSEDGYSNLFLLMDYDLEKGAKPIGAGSGAGTGGYAPWVSWVYPVVTNPVVRPDWTGEQSTWYTPPELETYETMTFHSHDSKLNAKWKTAVIANNRAYIGNVKRQQKSTFDGGGSWHQSATPINDPEYQDMIIKSRVGMYDKFPEENIVQQFGTDDGDYIVKLETFADRLFVFKKHKLIILNIQEDREIPEAELAYLGLDGGHPAQSCKTEIGIAWMNSQGVYFYDGKNVQSLTDNKIRNMWVGEDDYVAFWLSDAQDIPAIAYDPASKKLMCIKTITDQTDNSGSNLEHILMYSFKSKSWTYKENALTNDKEKRFTVYKNELIFDNESQIQTWTDTPAAGAGTGTNIITTKDYDFGTPGVRKKVYKVYVTYKTGNASGSVSTHVQVKYGVDGEASIAKTFKDNSNGNFSSNELGATASSADWHVAELKPSTGSQANSIKSFRLAFTTDNTVPAGFEINDITIVYRTKSIK